MDLDAMLPRAIVDAHVRVAPIASTLPGGRRLADGLSATQDEVLFDQPGFRVLIRGTEEVVVDLDDGANIDQLRPMLYGAAVQTLLLHAGVFCLHATVVRHGKAVVALAGYSGAGKSTTATALSRHPGAALMVDDVVPARVFDDRPQVQVFHRPVHLTPEAVDRLELSFADTTVLFPGPRGKVAVPATHFGAAADGAAWIDLDRLVALSVASDEGEADERTGPVAATSLIERAVSGADRLRWIVRLSNLTGLATFGNRGAAYFEWATALANALPMVNIVRPDGADTLHEVCAAVMTGCRH